MALTWPDATVRTVLRFTLLAHLAPSLGARIADKLRALIEGFKILHDPKNLSGGLGLLAVLADERGDIARAEQLHAECIAISEAQGPAGRPERHRGNYAEFLLRTSGTLIREPAACDRDCAG